MKTPKIDHYELSNDHQNLTVTFTVDPSLDWFKGHFNHMPILPGIATISFLIEFTHLYLNIDLNESIYSINQLKFTTTVVPNQQYEMKIELLQKNDQKFLNFKLINVATKQSCAVGKFSYE